jgi:hypothetical protein
MLRLLVFIQLNKYILMIFFCYDVENFDLERFRNSVTRKYFSRVADKTDVLPDL